MIFLGLGVICLCLGVWLLWRAHLRRRDLGLPPGNIVYADTGRWKQTESPILSQRWGLVGRPDYLVEQGQMLIPVELKSGPRPEQVYLSHLLQLGSYCLLVEDWTGRRPSHGLLRYEDATVEIPYDDRLRDLVIETLERMRRDLSDGDVPRSHEEPARCRGCAVRHACDQRLV
ncbi:MAG: CRISPR-associated protein Cas4 [Anaerolineae bacterium]